MDAVGSVFPDGPGGEKKFGIGFLLDSTRRKRTPRRKRKPGSARRLRGDGGCPLRCGGSCHRWARLLRNGFENVTVTGR
jgi:hypothetical protein